MFFNTEKETIYAVGKCFIARSGCFLILWHLHQSADDESYQAAKANEGEEQGEAPTVCQITYEHIRNHHTQCLSAVLVSARIAKGERDIMNTAINQGNPVKTVEDNGFPTIFHPSEWRTGLYSNNKLLIDPMAVCLPKG